MDSKKGLWVGLSLSVFVHAGAAGALVYGPTPTKASVTSEPIEISFVQYPSAPLAETKQPIAPKPPRKKYKVIPVPRLDTEEIRQPSEFEKAIRAKIEKQEAQLLKLSANTDIPDKNKLPQTSAEILTDPVRGKIFVGYFGNVKHAIQDLLVKKYAKRAIGHGSVYLFFVLNDSGALEKISVVDKESTADEYLRELAVQCVRDAAPFGNFPQSLGTDRISFNVTIYFEER